MEVIEIKEQSDGSAIVELDVTEEEKQMLLNVGFETMIRRGMEIMKDDMEEMDNPIGLETPTELSE